MKNFFLSYHARQLVLPCDGLRLVEKQGLTVWVPLCACVLIRSSITLWRGKGGLEHRLWGNDVRRDRVAGSCKDELAKLLTRKHRL